MTAAGKALVYLAIPLAPLAGAILAGVFGRVLGRVGAHTVTILGVAVAFVLSAFVVLPEVLTGQRFNGPVYTWAVVGGVPLEIGFLVDELTALMMVVVTFVSLMVHLYTIGYMREDPGYQRFFSYIALFTFSMLMLVMANNFLQLFFGWEAVGLCSYLLIGFWYERPTATYAQLKAFLVNRVGDFGFLLGIAAIYYYFDTLDYQAVFAIAPQFAGQSVSLLPGLEANVPTLICLLLFLGAMGKSAQMPLHVWLPDSMEGPTPISALIHAATMVTAGVFLVARMSPLYELSETALSTVLVIGALTALFMGLVGMVQNDIKRVVAYSTLSQLGYMMAAVGVSAYSVGIFHLMTHAFFKALLFLAAGSVILALHHEQDMRRMGALASKMPLTCITAWIGGLALAGIPPFSGFFSKDMILEAVRHSTLPGSTLAWLALLAAVFVTAFYTARMLFLTFHGSQRLDEHTWQHVHESPWVVTLPLVALAIPSLLVGALTIEPLLFGGYFGDSLKTLAAHDVVGRLAQDYHGLGPFIAHGLQAPPLLLAAAGFGAAWLLYLRDPALPQQLSERIPVLYRTLTHKYYFDEVYDFLFAGGARAFGHLLWQHGDVRLIDGLAVNGTARAVGWIARALRPVQSGYLYHYAFAMILGLFLLITFFLHR